MAHGFFLAMGGFVYEDEDGNIRPITMKPVDIDRVVPVSSITIINRRKQPSQQYVSMNTMKFNPSSPDTDHISTLDIIALVREEDICDKGKGDLLSKGLAIIQVL